MSTFCAKVGPEERAAVEVAIMDAFVHDSDEAWGALLEATGAADFGDGRAEAPAIDVQHAETGRKSEKQSESEW